MLKNLKMNISWWIMNVFYVIFLIYIAFFMNVYCFYNERLKIEEKYLRSGVWDKEAADFPEHWKACQKMLCEYMVLKCVRLVLKCFSEIVLKRCWKLWVILSQESLSKGGEWIPGYKNRLMENSSWGFVLFWVCFISLQDI